MKRSILFIFTVLLCSEIIAQSSPVSSVGLPPNGKNLKFSADKTVETDSLSKEKELSEIVITAQRSATNRFSTAEAIDIISAKHLAQKQARTTPEALMGVNGVFVQKTNHGGGSPFVRGLTGNQTLLLIDGVRLNNATFRYGPTNISTQLTPSVLIG